MTDHDQTLQAGIDAIRRGDKATAQSLFQDILNADPTNVQALVWLAGVASTRAQKQRILEQVQQLDPDHHLAQQGLDALGATPVTATTAPPAEPASEAPLPATAETPPPPPPSRQRRRVTAARNTSRVRGTLVLGARSSAAKRWVRQRKWLVWVVPALALCAFVVGAYYLSNRNNPSLASANVAAAPSTDGTTTALLPPGSTTSLLPGVQAGGAPSTAAITLTAILPLEQPSSTASSPAPSLASPSASSPVAAAPSPVPSVAASSTVTSVPTAVATPRPSSSTSPAATPRPSSTAPAAARTPDTSTEVVLFEPEETLSQDSWEWSFYGLSNVTRGEFTSIPPSNGRYLIVLMLVRNTTGAAAPIPDGTFIVTDAQGRSTSFNRQASTAYMRRYGVGRAGDYPANAEIPSTRTPVSVPLLFDVAPDATNLVVTSVDDPTRGFLVRQAITPD